MWKTNAPQEYKSFKHSIWAPHKKDCLRNRVFVEKLAAIYDCNWLQNFMVPAAGGNWRWSVEDKNSAFSVQARHFWQVETISYKWMLCSKTLWAASYRTFEKIWMLVGWAQQHLKERQVHLGASSQLVKHYNLEWTRQTWYRNRKKPSIEGQKRTPHFYSKMPIINMTVTAGYWIETHGLNVPR